MYKLNEENAYQSFVRLAKGAAKARLATRASTGMKASIIESS